MIPVSKTKETVYVRTAFQLCMCYRSNRPQTSTFLTASLSSIIWIPESIERQMEQKTPVGLTVFWLWSICSCIIKLFLPDTSSKWKARDVTASKHCPGTQARSLLHTHTHTHTRTHTHTHTHTEMHTVYKGTRWTLYTSSPAYGTHVTLDTWAPEGDSVSP